MEEEEIEGFEDEDVINQKYKDTQKRIISQKMDLYIPSLRDMIQSKVIDLEPKFQRRDRWSRKQQSDLIESIIMGVPIPPIFLAEEDFNKYTVMDGKQRLTAITSFLNNEYPLEGLKEWNELNGKKFLDLTPILQGAINRRSISAVVILKESDLEIKFDIFERINTGGEHLNPQEVRNCMFRGAFNDLVITLSSEQIFRNCLDLPLSIDKLKNNKIFQQMEDVQLVLRFFALQEYQSISGNLKTALNNYMKNALKFNDENLKRHKDLFINTLEKIYKVYQKQSFRKWDPYGKRWTRISVPFYDAVMYAFSKIKLEDIKDNEIKIINGTKKLFEDDDFIDSIRKGTNSQEANRVRFSKFSKMLKTAMG